MFNAGLEAKATTPQFRTFNIKGFIDDEADSDTIKGVYCGVVFFAPSQPQSHVHSFSMQRFLTGELFAK